jgi:hypothetical protein
MELRELVRQGYGFALVREGSKIDDELTTRPVANVNWMVNIAIAYNRERHPKTIPVLIRHLKRYLADQSNKQDSIELDAGPGIESKSTKRPPRSGDRSSAQMNLLG